MTISYNGEAAEAGAFQSELTLDTSKLPEGSSYFTVQVGTYDTAKGAYLASELYRFNVTMTGDYRPVIDTVTVTVYQTYVQSLVITEGGKQVFKGYGDWPGKEFDITLESLGAYTLTVLPMNTTAANTYSMTVSYNGEAAEAGTFQSEMTLDTSKLPEGSSYFTVQVLYRGHQPPV